MGLEQNNEQHYREVVDKYVNPDESYQMTTRDYVVRPSADVGSGAIIITLPPVAEAKGRIYTILARTADPVNFVTIADKDDSEGWAGDYNLICDGNSMAFYSDGMKWWYISNQVGVLAIKTVILAPAIKTLAATQVELVPALGANILTEFLSAKLLLASGTEILSESDDNLVIKYTDAAGVAVSDIIETTGFINQAVDTVTNGVAVKDAIVAATASVNQALVLDNNGTGEFGGNGTGDSTLTVWTLFRMIDVG